MCSTSPRRLSTGEDSKILILYVGGTIGMDSRNGVYEPVPNILHEKLKFSTSLNDSVFIDSHPFVIESNFLALPKLPNGKRIIYKIIEYCPLLDSSNMSMKDWVIISEDIYANYRNYDGFVILHGTDTMSYTASALSFILENLGKPVILTGSQIPLVEIRSDGRDNFLGALIFATYQIPEVCVYFNHQLYRGNRSRKIDNSSFSAFNSPNMPPLANMGVEITVDWDSVFPCSITEPVRVHTQLCPDVALLQLFPGISSETVKSFLLTPLKGLVLESYGAGNAPSNRPDLIELLKEATTFRQMIIVNCTQCPVGSVSCSYATGKILMEAGVIPGFDMTPEAALTKLCYVLGKTEWDLDQKKKMMSTNLRGELTIKAPKSVLLRDYDLLNTIANSLNLSSSPEIKELHASLFPLLLCLAALSNDIKTMEMLLEKGGNVNMTDYDNRTPLHIAASHGNLEILNFLLRRGASVFVKDRFNATPLFNAITFKQFDIIKALTNVGAHLVVPPLEIGEQLCQAALRDDVDSIKAWEMAGADLKLANYNNDTAYTLAKKYGGHQVLGYLQHDTSLVTPDSPNSANNINLITNNKFNYVFMNGFSNKDDNNTTSQHTELNGQSTNNK